MSDCKNNPQTIRKHRQNYDTQMGKNETIHGDGCKSAAPKPRQETIQDVGFNRAVSEQSGETIQDVGCNRQLVHGSGCNHSLCAKSLQNQPQNLLLCSQKSRPAGIKVFNRYGVLTEGEQDDNDGTPHVFTIGDAIVHAMKSGVGASVKTKNKVKKVTVTKARHECDEAERMHNRSGAHDHDRESKQVRFIERDDRDQHDRGPDDREDSRRRHVFDQRSAQQRQQRSTQKVWLGRR